MANENRNLAKQMSQEMIDNIKNYADKIDTLEDFITAVRKRPGTWLTGVGDPGFIGMIREVFQNSLDELNRVDSPCDKVVVMYDERTLSVVIEDNGRGIPFDNIIRVFTSAFTSSNYTKKAGEYSSGLNGVGAKVTNALSSKFIVESFILGDARRVEFKDGYPWNKGEVKIPNKNGKQGTRIMFQPSTAILGDLATTWQQVFGLVKMLVPLNKLGAVVDFEAIDANGKSHKERLVNKDGIMSYLIEDTTKPLIKPIHLFKDNGTMKAEILFTYSLDENAETTIHAFSNYCPTMAGTHVDGFMDGIGYFFSNYMNKTYISKDASTAKKKSTKNKLSSVTAADTREALCAVISAAHLDPQFIGQAKERLSNQDMRPFVKNMTIDLLDRWSKDNPNDFLKICKYLKSVAEIRAKGETEKVKISNRFSSSPLTSLPSKYVAPIGKKDLELWIVEGDSAAGNMMNYRAKEMQGYFPIRGKIANAFTMTRAKFLSNAEVAGICTIIFDGYKDFDINKLGTSRFKIDVTKLKWKKIIFGVDADADGKHIATLLLSFFVVYMPELLEAGMIYEAQPPLYGIANGKGSNKKMTYLNEKMDYVKIIQKEFIKKYTITTVDKKSISQAELAKILYKNMDYTYEVLRISNRYAIDPTLLESVLLLRGESAIKMQRQLKKVYRFIDVEENNGTKIISGIANDQYQTIFLNERLLSDCLNIISIINNNKHMGFYMNGQPIGLYELMYAFDSMAPSNIERYKGLGEMDERKLFESTMDPNNRTLIQFTMDDAVKTLETLRYYENNLNELIQGVKVSRFDIMD